MQSKWIRLIWLQTPPWAYPMVHRMRLGLNWCFFKVLPSKIPPNFIHYKKYIGREESESHTNLHSFFDVYKNIMVKMDIE